MSLADSILASLSDHPQAPPEHEAFMAWCATDGDDCPPGISRFLFALFRARPDLQAAFLGVYLDPQARVRFLEWAHHFAHVETGAPAELIPSFEAIESARQACAQLLARRAIPTRAVGVVGYLDAVLGLGNAARRIVDLLALADEEVHLYAYGHTGAPRLPRNSDAVGRNGLAPAPTELSPTRPDIVVSVLGPHELGLLPTIVGEATLDRAIRVALCFWETEILPAELGSAFAGVAEIWVTSEFTARSLRAAVEEEVEIVVVPMGTTIADPTPLQADGKSERAGWDWSSRLDCQPETIVVGQVFDYSSGMARKNPEGLLDAWSRAFPSPDVRSQVLVFKTVGSDVRPEDSQAFIELLADVNRPDIRLIDGALPAAEHAALMARFNIVASLHRAEGYGMVLLEALHRGAAVLATGYSGNLAFMTGSNSWLVPATPTVLSSADGPYPAGSQWAEPDVAEAGLLLRRIVAGLTGADSTAAQEVSDRCAAARRDAQVLVEGSMAAALLKERLAILRARRS
jgi:glycosyltransferase involved in cell wall biosynthesis